MRVQLHRMMHEEPKFSRNNNLSEKKLPSKSTHLEVKSLNAQKNGAGES